MGPLELEPQPLRPTRLPIYEQLTALRSGLTAEEYRWKLIRQRSRKLISA
jgi:hypothetical protein